MSEYTPEPWEQHVGGNPGSVRICEIREDVHRGCAAIAEAEIIGRTRSEAVANARRIVACVNACKGVATELLEDGRPHGQREIHCGNCAAYLAGDFDGTEDPELDRAELASRDKKITALLAALEGMLVYVEPMLTNVGAYRPPAVHAARAAIAEARGVKA